MLFRSIIPPAVVALAGMPGPAVEGDELGALSAAINQQVGGYLEALKLREIGMKTAVQCIGKEGLDATGAEFPRGETDIMDYQQVDGHSRRPLVAVRRGTPAHTREPAACYPAGHSHANTMGDGSSPARWPDRLNSGQLRHTACPPFAYPRPNRRRQ